MYGEAKGDVEFLSKLADEAYSMMTTIAVEFNTVLVRLRLPACELIPRGSPP